MKDFFISYNKADRAWAEWIAWQLEEAGYSVVIQAWDFLTGGNFVLDMQKAAKEAGRTIAVLSPDYLTSEFAASEWVAAFRQDPTGKKGRLLPVRVRECEPEGLLPQIVYIDLVKLDNAAAKQALLGGVKRGRKKPDKEPVYPGAPSRTIKSEPRFPGAMPDIWNIPFLRNQNFTGREDNLAELRDSLNAGETAALVQAQAIHGLGGIGKTQLAVEYAYRHGTDYDIVWWMRSEDPVTLASDYASLAAELGLSEKDATEQRFIVEAVKKWLRQNRGWLLIFDNAEDSESVRNYIPRGGMGHIIITSRNRNWTGVAKSLPVTSLPLDKAIEFLLKRTGDQDEAKAKALAEAVGCLPLALDQASAYIETSGCTIVHYLKLFKERQRDLLKRGKPSTDYPNTVATTWDISFQNVTKENEAAAQLLRLCAFFAPDDIPLKMITEGAEELPESLAAVATNSLLLDEALMALRQYSLVEVEDEKISIHRLVQAVIRHAMNDEVFKYWTGIAVHVVNISFPQKSNDVRIWPLCTPLVPHASVALSHAGESRFTSNETARLLNEVGIYMEAHAELAQAENLHERAIAVCEVMLGPNHPHVAILANNLASVLEEQGRLEEARALYERALAISEATHGHNHPDVAIQLNNISDWLRERGYFEAAQILLERAFAISEATHGLNYTDIATLLSNFGTVLILQGDLETAQILLERAIAIGEVILGPNHPDVAISLNSLGDLLREQGQLEKAQVLYERALAIVEATLGPNHPAVAIQLNNLGRLRREQGRLDDAKALGQRALQICQKVLGDDHQNTKIIQNNLRLLEEEMKKRG